MSQSERARALVRAAIDLVAVGAAVGFIAGYFPANLMFSSTTTNGGDMGSHYYPAVYLRQVLLPRWRVTGWCPGNYCGYPLFQFYFPLPFVLIAGLSLVTGLPVAFKLITVLGTFLLPPCAYLGLRLLGVPFPGPALGALGSLCFIFMEANSMWGGNIPSNLAGEFAFSLALALTVLFLGTLHRTVETGKGRAWNGLLVAAIGLAHGYMLLWAGANSLMELISTRGWWRRFGILVAVHGLAILLMGFFILPMVGYAPWTTAFNHVWPIQSWREVLPPILWPAAGVATATAVVQGVVSAMRREPYPRPLAMLWGSMVLSLLFYLTAHSFKVPDIRFIPFIQLGVCLAAGAGLGYFLGRLPSPEIWPLVGALTVLPFVQARVTFIPSWIKWNYSGFETKGAWPPFHEVNQYLHGTFRDPRVVYEHSPDHEAIGTVRAFEDLPLFSGRSTLEGLYMQSAPTSPFVFYIQSEISKDISCPFPDWGCSRLDLDHGIAHLRMMNVSQFIVRSQKVKALVAQHPGLKREKVIPPYEIYRIVENDGRYAIPLAVAPIAVRTANWKDTAYRWFKTARPEDPVPVFIGEKDTVPDGVFAAVVDGLGGEWPRQPLAPAPTVAEELDTDRVTVTGCRPGQPLLIRISYHPRWKALGGERVWLAAPSFMLVVPTSDRLELVFDGGTPVTVGHGFTTVGCVLFLGATLLPLGRRKQVIAALAASPPWRALAGLVRPTEQWPLARRRQVLMAGLVVAVGLYAGLAAATHEPDADTVYRAGQKLYDAGKLREALPYFQRAQRLSPLSAIAVHANFYQGIILYRDEDLAEAAKVFLHLITSFPEAPNAPEALYHIGLCRSRLGNVEGAVQAWQETERRFSDSDWARYARDRLNEIGR